MAIPVTAAAATTTKIAATRWVVIAVESNDQFAADEIGVGSSPHELLLVQRRAQLHARHRVPDGALVAIAVSLAWQAAVGSGTGIEKIRRERLLSAGRSCRVWAPY
jgi:hypothetical protein